MASIYDNKYLPVTPDNYRTPLQAGGFTFLSPYKIFPYIVSNALNPSNTCKYELHLYANYTQIGEREYIIITDSTKSDHIRSTSGDNSDLFVKLTSLGTTYKAVYTFSVTTNTNQRLFTHTATYSFTVVENQLPMKEWTITDVINRTLALAEPLRQGEKPRIRLNSEQSALFDNILAPQFSFTKQTLRECLQEVGKVIHGEPRLSVVKEGNGYVYELSYDMYGGMEMSDLARRKYSLKQTSHAVESFATSLDSNVENLVNSLDKYSGVIVEPYGGDNGFKSVRTEQQYIRITESNMIIATQYPIYTVEKLECLTPDGKVVDITPYIFEKSVYNTRLSSYSSDYPYAKSYAVMYSQGEKNITALNFKSESASAIIEAYKSYAIINILRRAMGNSSFSIGAEAYPKLAFRVTYTPIYNARVAQTKPYYMENPRAAALIINQQANIAESRYYGENLKGMIARIGNVEQTITYLLPELSDVPRAGQRFDEDYYIAAVSVEYLPTYIKCTVGLSKDFNRLSQYIGIPSERRYSEISQTQASERNVLYREYVVIGDAETPSTDSLIGDKLMEAIGATFSCAGSHYPYKPLTNVVAWGRSAQGNNTPAVNLPVVTSAFGNSISFSWKYEDNFSAGATAQYGDYETDSKGNIVRGYFQNDRQYTDYYGRIYYYNFDLQVEGGGGDNTRFSLPAGEPVTSSSGYFSTVGKTPYILRKDNREALQVNVQIDFVTNRRALIIGSALASYCGAVRGSDDATQPKLYVFDSPLNKFINHVEGAISVKLSDLPSVTINSSDIVFENGRFSLKKAFPASGKAWAIVTTKTSTAVEVEDEEGNRTTQTKVKGGDVLLAQNMDVVQGEQLTLHFTRKRKIYDEAAWVDSK